MYSILQMYSQTKGKHHFNASSRVVLCYISEEFYFVIKYTSLFIMTVLKAFHFHFLQNQIDVFCASLCQ